VSSEQVSSEQVSAEHEMAPARVVRLANDIAVQFSFETDDRAARAIAAHITTFWEPRMTTELVFAVLQPDSGLFPRAEAAARLLAGER
jgi:formate dehydrogenase subunit delta